MTNKEFQNKLNELEKVGADLPEGMGKSTILASIGGIMSMLNQREGEEGAKTTARGAFVRPVAPSGDGQAAICCVGSGKVEE